VETTAAVTDRFIELESSSIHSHAPGAAEHGHAGTAFTTWLDPEMAGAQARAIHGALVATYGANPAYDEGLERLEADLAALDAEFTAVFATAPGLLLLASHPVYQYFARRYDLRVESLLWEPGEDPSEEAWAEFARVVEKHPAKMMLWEGPPHPETARRLESLGIRVAVVEPCATAPETGDYLTVMRANVASLKAALTR